jgi:hypothetical protein
MKMGDLKTKKRRFFVLIETLKIWLFFNANILNDLNDRDGTNYDKRNLLSRKVELETKEERI